MADPVSDDLEAAGAADSGAPNEYPELVPGRGSLRDYALKRLKASRLLQVSAVIAVLSYGAIPFLVMVKDRDSTSGELTPRLEVRTAALMVLMSLASWSLLFWWYPVLERTQQVLGDDARGRTIARTLESLAIGCVVIVHVLMAFIIVRLGVSS